MQYCPFKNVQFKKSSTMEFWGPDTSSQNMLQLHVNYFDFKLLKKSQCKRDTLTLLYVSLNAEKLLYARCPPCIWSFKDTIITRNRELG